MPRSAAWVPANICVGHDTLSRAGAAFARWSLYDSKRPLVSPDSPAVVCRLIGASESASRQHLRSAS